MFCNFKNKICLNKESDIFIPIFRKHHTILNKNYLSLLNNYKVLTATKIKYFFIFFLLFQFYSLNTFSQESEIIEKINQKQGLSNSKINGIIKDKDGFIWISTQNGLNKYDGFNFEVYQQKNSNISSNDITNLIIDSNNRIWVATLGGGICLYDKEKNNFKIFKNTEPNSKSIISNQTNVLYEDSKGLIWIGTDKGLTRFNPTTTKFENFTNQEIASVNITSFYEGKNGVIYIGTYGKGLFIFNQKTDVFEKINFEQENKIRFINVISSLNSDNLLIGTSYNGLRRLDLNTNVITDYFEENNLRESPMIVRSIKIDSKGNLWVGSDGKGLFKVESPNSKKVSLKRFEFNPESKSGLSGNAIYVIAEINQNSIWIGTAWNGINIIDYQNTSKLIYSDIIGNKPFPVLSINKTKNKLLIGTDGNGLTIYDAKLKRYNEINLDAKYIQHISISKDSSLWIGTFSNGLIKYDFKKNSIKKYIYSIENKNSISFNNVRDLIFEENNIWIATWGGGLNYFDSNNEKFTSYQYQESNKEGLSSNNIVSIEKDNEKIWIATFGGGLNLFNPKTKKFKQFKFSETNTKSISSDYLFSLYKDSNNYLWIGTSGAGICRMNLETFSIERFNEYKYNSITSIIEDVNHNIWFGTKKGILRYDYKSNTIKQSKFLSGDFHLNSVYIDDFNNLYFGGINGITKFNPNQIDLTFNPVKVFITDFKLFNKKVPITNEGILNKNIQVQKEIILNYSENVFTFEYAGLKFPYSNDVEYAIKLENFDQEWREVGRDRTATFTNLSPGDYIFKVKAKEIDDQWNDNFTSIKITVLKPFWMTWWAISIYTLIFFLIVYFLRKNFIEKGRLKSSLEFEKLMHEKDNELYNLKQQFFTNISHEIRTPVTLIISSINRLFNNENTIEGKKIKAANTIRRNSNLLLRLVNELLDVKKLENNDIELKVTKNEIISFVKEIYLSFSDVALDRGIKYEFRTDLTKSYLWFDKSQLEKVIFNLISNAFKFTNDKGKIQVIIEDSSEKIFIQVVDNGIGLSLENQKKIFDRFYQVSYDHSSNNRGFGLGLSIVKEIVKLHHGNIKVFSQIKEGSTFDLSLLKGAAHFKNINDDDIETEDLNKRSIENLKNKIDKTKKRATILVVEDNVEIQEFLKEFLEISNFTVIQAFNGLEGLQLVIKHLPNLVISDLMMPKMDGTTLTKKIKTNTITNHIPVIILTAKSSIEDKKLNFIEGADDYITKPFDESLLLSRIENLLKARSLLKSKFIEKDILNPKTISTNSKDQDFLENIYKILEENLDSNNLKAEDIARDLNMSHSSLYKKIKELTGLTFIEFLRDYKLSIAKQLIQEMGYSVSEACYKVGYSDRKYFSKLFKNKFKKTPSSFLKK